MVESCKIASNQKVNESRQKKCLTARKRHIILESSQAVRLLYKARRRVYNETAQTAFAQT
ncbi:predicted protein [Neisseria gonorrhoeae SK-93-1035]|nr:predicted protein [Neisseria gonorrhoeae SK-93-1035]KLR80419.1 hypothetical protein M680_08950 [Neisseria gonorrhoeae SK8976]KLR85185.1 hypothetical protein M675_10460 [Neisseria gonorrhoeae SK1902]KLR98565.1 hypothetical protein M674_09180 [Neisseria gonorrhoeae SK708]KLS37008.1 hypothetical protein M735_08355 [Neisseria gonorrhoeae MIA_2011_03-09]